MTPTFQSEYLRAAHDPFQRVLVEATWLDENEFQKFISAGGPELYQGALERLRQEIAHRQAALKICSIEATKHAGRIADIERTQNEYLAAPPMYRDHAGRLRVACHEVEEATSRLINARQQAAQLKRQQDDHTQQIPLLANIEKRLAAGIVRYFTNRANAPTAETSPPSATPSVNVTVEMPAEMKMAVTSLPTRETTSTVSRDNGGNITSTTQIERDAAAA
jgi:hypothetical protein